MPELELVETEMDELAKAKKMIADADMANRQKVLEAINKALEDNSYQLSIEVVIGQQAVPIGHIINTQSLPVRVSITPK